MFRNMLEADACVLETLAEESASEDELLKSIRKVKNQIIGNKQKKLAYLGQGAIRRVLDVLKSHEGSKGLWIQASVALASFSYHTEKGMQALNEQCGVETLLQMLDSSDDDVVEAGARALKMVYQSPLAPVEAVCGAAVNARLAALLARRSGQVAEMVAAILARCWRTAKCALCFADTAAVSNLMDLLLRHPDPTASSPFAPAGPVSPASSNLAACPLRRAALEALSHMAAHSTAASRQVLAACPMMDYLVAAICSQDLRTRLLACSVLTHLLQAAPEHLSLETLSWRLPPSLAQEASSSGTPVDTVAARTAIITHLQMLLLPVLVKLLSHKDPQPEVPVVLACLISQRTDLQRAVADSDAIQRLSALLISQVQELLEATPGESAGAAGAGGDGAPPGPPQQASLGVRDCELQQRAGQLRGTLECIACLCAVCGKNRAVMCRQPAITAMARCMTLTQDPAVRTALANCIRVMARWAQEAKLECFSDPALASGLLAMLQDSNVGVRNEVCLALCNLGVKISPLRKRLMEQGVMEQLAGQMASDSDMLRAHATWAMANLVHDCSIQERQQLLQQLAWPTVAALLPHRSRDVAQYAWLLLQNLTTTTQGSPAYLAEVLDWSGGSLVQVVAELLDSAWAVDGAADQGAQGMDEDRPQEDPGVVTRMITTASNIATGGPEQRALIVDSSIIQSLPKFLRYTDANEDQAQAIVTAAAFLVINIMFRESAHAGQCESAPLFSEQLKVAKRAMQVLQDAGVPAVLEALKDSDNVEISERSKTALQQMARLRRFESE